MRVLSGRIIFDILLLAAAAFGLWQAWSLPHAVGISEIGAGDFPAIICILGICATLAVLFQDLKQLAGGSQDGAESALDGRQIGAVTAIAGLLAAYMWLLEPLGFIFSTIAFLFTATLGCAWFLLGPSDRREWVRIAAIAAIVAVVATLMSYVAFSEGFGLIFP